MLSAALLVATPAAFADPGGGDPPGAQGAGAVAAEDLPQGSERALVRLALPDRAALEALVAADADIAAVPAPSPESRDGLVLVDLVLTGDELTALRADGATVRQVIQREGDAQQRFEASREAAQERHAAGLSPQTVDGVVQPADTVAVDYAYWWESGGQVFLQVQASTSATADPDLEIEVEWETQDGTTGSFPLFRYVDAGQYMYHYYLPMPLPDVPVSVTATSSEGGTATAGTAPWPGTDAPELPEGYQHDFIDHYMTPAEIGERIDRLADQYSDLVDVVELPNATNGYRRTAKAVVGDRETAAIIVESVDYGSEGMNDTEVIVEAPTEPDAELTGDYIDRTLFISLATDADGQVTSTTDEVAAYITAQFPDTFNAFVAQTSEGETMTEADAVLSDDLAASHLPDEGQTVRLLRIGKHRDGSRPGVFTYSQEHAREWVTPLANLEFAERMLANAHTDEETAQLLEETEIFVLPVVNPDGANYSFYDDNWQRKNMTEHCTGQDRDPRYADGWGVDINRNYAVGSYHDGYVGGSANCLSGTYAGPAELSEPESSNVVAVAESYPNITHAINVHSYGGYFMWSPGAYKMPGRETLPYPDPATLAEFQDASARIIAAIAGHRDTVTWTSNTGPVTDVLYSAAGNSGDHLYYEFDIIAWDFEVGNDVWREDFQQWQGVGFQPEWDEAHEESQEYAAGLVELVRVAADANRSVTRLRGEDRYATSVAIGQEAFPEATTATLVSGEESHLVDGLVAAPLAYQREAPLLATRSAQLSPVVADDLAARNVTEVTVVGGTAAVGEGVVEDLEAMGITVTRVGGADRYETAVGVADLIGGTTAVVASGEPGHLIDALAVSGAASDAAVPIVLVRRDQVPDPTAAWLDAETDSSVAVGGSAAISEAVLGELPDAVRVSGANRWSTAVAVADHYVAAGLDASSVTVGSGEPGHLVDALPGGVLGEPILLTRVAQLPPETGDWIAASGDTAHAYVLGGTQAVGQSVVEELEALLAAD
ncbi:hypothetical protein GCM10009583_08390 [Ornithinicoccus hortensis]